MCCTLLSTFNQIINFVLVDAAYPNQQFSVMFGNFPGSNQYQGWHRIEKYLILKGFLEKSLKIQYALKSTEKITQRP